jgi:transcription elongation factor Elf1
VFRRTAASGLFARCPECGHDTFATAIPGRFDAYDFYCVNCGIEYGSSELELCHHCVEYYNTTEKLVLTSVTLFSRESLQGRLEVPSFTNMPNEFGEEEKTAHVGYIQT